MTVIDLDLDHHLVVQVVDPDAENYGRHAQWTHPGQISVWDLYGPWQPQHRLGDNPEDEWEVWELTSLIANEDSSQFEFGSWELVID